MPKQPELPLVGAPEMSEWWCQPVAVSLVPCGAMCACSCVRVPALAWGLFVFLLIGLFFHVQPTKPHVFPLISPARLGWSPRHARGQLAGPQRRGGLPTPLARRDQAGWGRVTLPAPALSRPHPHSSSCLALEAHGLSQPYFVATLNTPQFLDFQMLPFCLPQAALSFPARQG